MHSLGFAFRTTYPVKVQIRDKRAVLLKYRALDVALSIALQSQLSKVKSRMFGARGT